MGFQGHNNIMPICLVEAEGYSRLQQDGTDAFEVIMLLRARRIPSAKLGLGASTDMRRELLVNLIHECYVIGCYIFICSDLTCRWQWNVLKC